MAEGGKGESSEAVSQPPGVSAAVALRTVFLSYASPDAEAAHQICGFPESQAHDAGAWMGSHFGRYSCSSLQGSTKWTKYSSQALFAQLPQSLAGAAVPARRRNRQSGTSRLPRKPRHCLLTNDR